MTEDQAFIEWKAEQYKHQSTEEELEFVEHLHNFPRHFKKTFLDGYHECQKEHEWHYVKDELPKESGKYLVLVGGVNGVFVLDFETEYNDFGYWCLQFGENLGVSDTVFETITERNEDKVIAWKEIVLPELKESE